MGNFDNYQDFREKIDMYLDRALSREDENAVVQRISQDPAAGRIYYTEKSFRDFLKKNIHRSNVSPNLIQTIKDKIRF